MATPGKVPAGIARKSKDADAESANDSATSASGNAQSKLDDGSVGATGGNEDVGVSMAEPVLLRDLCSADIQKHLCGEDFVEVWRMTECPSLEAGDGGFDPDRMLRFALSRVHDEEILDMDLSFLLKTYVETGMCWDLMGDLLKDPVNYVERYCIDRHEMTTEDQAFTLPRLALTFPYETAIARAGLFSVGRLTNDHAANLPGYLGDLPLLLAFPHAGMIIPTSGFSKLASDWLQWYETFIEERIGFKMPITLYDRVTVQVAAMRILAEKDREANAALLRSIAIYPVPATDARPAPAAAAKTQTPTRKQKSTQK